uniref:DNA polymerase n=1 Tax=Compsopogon caeruleus TaxID=31354 RepID=A0A1Z1XBG9_9RHOD|nr:DNA polymerase [Compsopogon caeruleus]ARX96176.1 DNA polymerase [Compsopogon caeruleus]
MYKKTSYMNQSIQISLFKKEIKFSDYKWRQIDIFVKRVQQKIYQASLSGNSKELHDYQKVLINSKSTKYYSLKKLIYSNNDFSHLDDLYSIMKSIEYLNFNNLAELSYINFLKYRNLKKKTATFKDLVLQNLVLVILEPEWEARLELSSYSFKNGNFIRQAIVKTHSILANNSYYTDATSIYCQINLLSSNLNTYAILKKAKFSPLFVNQLSAWISADYLEIYEKNLNYRFQYSCIYSFGQNNIAFLIADIILYGLEYSIEWYCKNKFDKYSRFSNIEFKFIRCANQILILLENHNLDIVNSIIIAIKRFLELIDIPLDNSIFTISSVNNGFDFLGYNFKRYKNYKSWNLEMSRIIILPSSKNIKKHFRSIKQCLYHKDKLNRWRANSQMRQDDVIEKLNPIIYNFSMYYRYFVPFRILKEIDWILNEIIYRYAIKKYKTAKYQKWFINWNKIVDSKKVIAYYNHLSKTYILLKFHTDPISNQRRILPQYYNYYSRFNT